ncbi:MAG: nucleotidyl transferase AbiEii/AbiGii toxin family protein [Elusimicrobia bacterium]|nr:nucleotidyl transferase AbiEii/AbiGii toxin family protein [Elusimicrobiota bacterium]
MLDPFETREFFHLAFLRHLALRLAGRDYAVKGGVALRLFHGSPRLSEDLDLDAPAAIRRRTLEGAVDSVLAGAPLRADLARQGVSLSAASKPKQTDTTQRWKLSLEAGAGPTATKVEFSRRERTEEGERGSADARLLDRYGLPVFGARHYGRRVLMAQKVRALAAPGRSAARDLFDLEHLRAREPEARSVLAALPEALRRAAAEKVLAFGYADFAGQVAPFLTLEAREAYDEAAFERLQEAAVGALLP